MLQVISGADARKGRKRIPIGGIDHWRTEYVGPPTTLGVGDELRQVPVSQRAAQAYLVEMVPKAVISTHFHCVNQFQVIVQGEGLFGRHAVRRGAVHYTGGYTGYGPIVAGAQGLAFFVLRAQFDFGAHLLPQSKHELKDVVREHVLVDNISLSDARKLSALRETAAAAAVIPERDGGLAANLARLGPGATFKPGFSGHGGGQYWLVLEGELLHKDENLPGLSCLFIPAAEEMPSLRAGALGAEVLMLQFPSNPVPQRRTKDASKTYSRLKST